MRLTIGVRKGVVIEADVRKRGKRMHPRVYDEEVLRALLHQLH